VPGSARPREPDARVPPGDGPLVSLAVAPAASPAKEPRPPALPALAAKGAADSGLHEPFDRLLRSFVPDGVKRAGCVFQGTSRSTAAR
jgi:hypothetical protein